MNRKGKVVYLLNPLGAGAAEPVTIAWSAMLAVACGELVGPGRRIAMPQIKAESALYEKQVPVTRCAPKPTAFLDVHPPTFISPQITVPFVP